MNRRDYTKPAPKRIKWAGPALKPIRYPTRLPQRNKLCPCKSGKKYKLCCKDIETLFKTVSDQAHL